MKTLSLIKILAQSWQKSQSWYYQDILHKGTCRDLIGSMTSIFISWHVLSKKCQGVKNLKTMQRRLLNQVGMFQLANSKEFLFLMLLWGHHDWYHAHCKEPTSSRLFSISSLGGLAFPARPSVPSICSKNYDPFSSVTTSTSCHPPPQPDPVFFLPSRLCGREHRSQDKWSWRLN